METIKRIIEGVISGIYVMGMLLTWLVLFINVGSTWFLAVTSPKQPIDQTSIIMIAVFFVLSNQMNRILKS